MNLLTFAILEGPGGHALFYGRGLLGFFESEAEAERARDLAIDATMQLARAVAAPPREARP